MILFENKNLRKHINITAPIASLITLACLVLGAQTALAAAAPPKCSNPFIDKTKFVTCTARLLVYPPDTGTFKAGKCYILVKKANGHGGTTYVWQSTAGCNVAPFKQKASPPSGGGGSVADLPDKPGDPSCVLAPGDDPASCRIFARWLFPIIDFLAVGVGVVVTIMIVIGGIQYSSARGNPNAVAAARSRIANAVLALVAYGFFWSFMQWLVPGGVF